MIFRTYVSTGHMAEVLHQRVEVVVISTHTLYQKSYLCIPRNETVRPCPNSATVIYLWAINIFPGSVCLFDWNKQTDPGHIYINRSQTHECGNWETEHYNSVLEITRQPMQFQSWEYINPNLTHIVDSERPFLCSVLVEPWPRFLWFYTPSECCSKKGSWTFCAVRIQIRKYSSGSNLHSIKNNTV